MEKLYFNTGVHPKDIHRDLMEYEEVRGALLKVFYVEDIPVNGKFDFAIPESSLEAMKEKYPDHEYRKIIKGGLIADYAFFKIIVPPDLPKKETIEGQFDRSKVVQNYYRASGALMEIGTTENIPEELKQLAINASSATLKIIDYINEHRHEVKA